MDSHFRDMREYIFETNEDLSRFRQIVVNTVRFYRQEHDDSTRKGATRLDAHAD